MFRNMYDSDCTTWSPQGRIHQIEYAMEAVKQGAATVAMKSDTHAVVCAFKRQPSELSTYQKKILQLDDHVGFSMAGLTADARMLSKYMQSECLNNRFVFDEALPISRLVSSVMLKMQVPTQIYGRRPYGVGLLVIGHDSAGPHVFQLCPSANIYECHCMAIGARSQSARTYLEKNLDNMKLATSEELVKHCLRALRDCLPQDQDLSAKNCEVAIVGDEQLFAELDDTKVGEYLTAIAGDPRAFAPPAAAAAEEGGDDAPPAEDAPVAMDM